ncbi:protein ligase Arkadia [Seminavis robusta]|uniref:Protein ligase Arkadia n=1 Tax=Seminavis robusta TaxID=568900 RepID=A0A9N8H2H6_9STRA|nr:protein ligase Arkadia [Seminavis robusta]|eukprot:Sro65_g036790.1 protein ligase Arkadia (385) ;mRNA; f:78831-79985
MDTDEEMIAVSPICKSTAMMNCPKNDERLDNTTFPGILDKPPSVARPSRPVLQHQHSYAGHEENMTERTETYSNGNGNGNDSMATRAPSGRHFLDGRQLSLPDLSRGLEESFHGMSSPSSSSFMNSPTSQNWIHHPSIRNHHQQHRQQQNRSFRILNDLEGDDAPRQSPVASSSNDSQDDQDDETVDVEETAEERAQREEEESIALAQMLMAEEAMASHRASADFLRMNSDHFSPEDFEALQNALQEEEQADYEEEVDEEAEESQEMSYEALLRLGERLGDVKTDRWTMIADKEIEKLKTFQYDPEKLNNTNGTSGVDQEGRTKDIDDSEIKCLVCQFPYEKGDDLRRLPCGHCFHKDCVDQWLKTKDVCAYCRQSIRPEENDN